jgi:hypothetical protein
VGAPRRHEPLGARPRLAVSLRRSGPRRALLIFHNGWSLPDFPEKPTVDPDEKARGERGVGEEVPCYKTASVRLLGLTVCLYKRNLDNERTRLPA